MSPAEQGENNMIISMATTVCGLLLLASAINYMDGCAWSLPCHDAGELPVGLMVSSVNGQDAHLASIALALEPLISP